MKLEPRDTETRRRRELPWQKRAFYYIDLVPELSYASGFYAKMLKKIRIFPAVRDEMDQLKPITEGLPLELLDRIQDPGGGRSQMLAMYGKLMFITGEGYLFGRGLGGDDEKWAFVAADEIEKTDKGDILWRPVEGAEPEILPAATTEAYRLWTPSPKRSGEATSPMRAIEEIAEELVILTRAVRATAVSRMVNGILKVPAELSFGSEDESPDDDPEDNKFLRSMIEHITGVVENAGTAEAASPFIAEGAVEFLPTLEWIKTHDTATDYMERDLRIEAVKRLSLGLDMPPEVLMGLANSNHWVGRQIMLEQWRSHGSPVAEQFADDISEAYLRPALREAKYPDWQRVVVGIDDSQVVVSPDRSQDADQAWDRLGISWAGYRNLKGIPEDLAPTEDEMKVMLAIKLRNPNLLDGTPYEMAAPQPVPGAPGRPALPNSGLNPSEEPPPPGPGGVSRRENIDGPTQNGNMAHEIQGAARLALLRCREVAGSRLRAKHRKDIQHLVDGQPNTEVAAIVGADRLESLGAQDPMALVTGGTDGFVSVLVELGCERSEADSLARMIRVEAAKTLCHSTAPPLPAGFIAHVQRLGDSGAVRHS